MNSNMSEDGRDNLRATRADDLAAEMLDAHLSAEKLAEFNVLERRRIGDLQFLDSLLEQLHGQNQPATRQSVEAVLRRLRAENSQIEIMPAASSEAIEETEKEGSPTILLPQALPAADRPAGTSVRRRHWLLALVAAALLLTLGVSWWQSGSNTAYALVEQAYEVALQATDRTYRVTIESAARAATPRIGTLHVRGSRQFAYEQPGPGPLSAKFQIGGNGRDYWFIPPIGPVLVHNSEGVISQWLKRAEADMPFLQISTLLQRLRDNYDLEMLPAESISAGGPRFERISGRLRSKSSSAGPLIPLTIEVWVDHRTGVIHRLTLGFADNAKGPRRISFDLAGDESLPADYYDCEHHAGNRRIVDLRKETQ